MKWLALVATFFVADAYALSLSSDLVLGKAETADRAQASMMSMLYGVTHRLKDVRLEAELGLTRIDDPSGGRFRPSNAGFEAVYGTWSRNGGFQIGLGLAFSFADADQGQVENREAALGRGLWNPWMYTSGTVALVSSWRGSWSLFDDATMSTELHLATLFPREDADFRPRIAWQSAVGINWWLFDGWVELWGRLGVVQPTVRFWAFEASGLATFLEPGLTLHLAQLGLGASWVKPLSGPEVPFLDASRDAYFRFSLSLSI